MHVMHTYSCEVSVSVQTNSEMDMECFLYNLLIAVHVGYWFDDVSMHTAATAVH